MNTEQQDANQRALSRMKRLFPALPKSGYYDFLVECTAFPFNSLIDAMEQCDKLSKRAHKDVRRAYRTVDNDINKAHEKYKKKRDAK